MKRGLKVIEILVDYHNRASYNLFPDEKGTESFIQTTIRTGRINVTTVSPMKRGLKEWYKETGEIIDGSYNRFPDEKGTESHQVTWRTIPLLRYNRFPDEKGTESQSGTDEPVEAEALQPFPR